VNALLEHNIIMRLLFWNSLPVRHASDDVKCYS